MHDALCDSRKDPEMGPYLPCSCKTDVAVFCSECSQQVPVRTGLLDYHDWPPMCRQVCPGSKTPAPTDEGAPRVNDDEPYGTTEISEHLALIARDLRNAGDVQLVRMDENGVSIAEVSLADELEIIAYALRGQHVGKQCQHGRSIDLHCTWCDGSQQ